ncbi:MAG: hypothetical protein PHW93_07270, partial [Candidatus Methanomethylophilaceae archaeon]|nr:hypothetical protein [Candidatus Methanomethylophilaceae archaeon]
MTVMDDGKGARLGAALMVAILLLSTALGGGLLFLASFGSEASGVGGGDWTITDEVTVSQHISY